MTEVAMRPGSTEGSDSGGDALLPELAAANATTGVVDGSTALPVDHFGTTVFVRSWRCDGQALPPIVIVHDIGEHADCYLPTALAFVQQGYSVYVYDWRGHGRSGRQLGHAPSFGCLVRDLLQVAAWARSQQQGKAPIILGHGVGALVVMEFTKQYGTFCRAAVLSAPCLELLADISWPRRLLLKIIADIAPLLRIRKPLAPRFTKDRLALHPLSGVESPLLSTKFPGLTASLTHELVAAVKRAEARFIEYNGSVLILCPERDSVCTYQQLKKSAAIHGDHNLDIADLPQTNHNVFTGDAGLREQAIHATLEWLTRLNAGADTHAAVEARVYGASRGAVPTNPAADDKPGATKS